MLALPLLLVAALPAAAVAAPADDLPGRTDSFSAVDGILIFGVVPVGVCLIVALLTLRPGTAPRSQRYRPGRGWHAEPSWSGPEPAQQAPEQVATLPTGEPVMPVMSGTPETEHPNSPLEAGHAHEAPGDIPAVGADDQPDAEPTPGARHRGPTTGGGARGSW